VAEATLRKFNIYGWNQRAQPAPTKFLEVGGRAWQSAQPDTLEYWKLLTELYANETVAPRDRVMFGMLRSLGIAPDTAFNPDARQTRILTDAANAANWIRTNPGKGWFPYFRFYAATEAYFDKSCQLNDIELVR
jgi:hypothetical protein